MLITDRFTEYLIDLRMAMKSVDRKSKKSEADALAAREQVKHCYALGNHEAARIHAETSIRHRHQSRHYQMLSARLAPLIDQLKHQLCAGLAGTASTAFDLGEIEKVIECANRNDKSGKFDGLQTTSHEILPHEIDGVIQQLDDELALELSDRLPSIDATNHNEVEERLLNLRR